MSGPRGIGGLVFVAFCLSGPPAAAQPVPECVQFAMGKEFSWYKRDSRYMTNACSFEIEILWCYRGGTGGSKRSVCGPEKFYKSTRNMNSGERYWNIYSLPRGSDITYGACKSYNSVLREKEAYDGRGGYTCRIRDANGDWRKTESEKSDSQSTGDKSPPKKPQGPKSPGPPGNQTTPGPPGKKRADVAKPLDSWVVFSSRGIGVGGRCKDCGSRGPASWVKVDARYSTRAIPALSTSIGGPGRVRCTRANGLPLPSGDHWYHVASTGASGRFKTSKGQCLVVQVGGLRPR